MNVTAIAGQFGIPVAILAAVGLGIWKSLSWFAKEIAKPLAEGHLTYLTTTAQQTDKMCDTLSALEVNQREIAATQKQIIQTQEQHFAVCRRSGSDGGSA
jgi:hypothetical protein